MERRLGGTTPRARAIDWARRFVRDARARRLDRRPGGRPARPPARRPAELRPGPAGRGPGSRSRPPGAWAPATCRPRWSRRSASWKSTQNPDRLVIVLTDGQRYAWRPGETGRWSLVRELHRRLPVPPAIWSIALASGESSGPAERLGRPAEPLATGPDARPAGAGHDRGGKRRARPDRSHRRAADRRPARGRRRAGGRADRRRRPRAAVVPHRDRDARLARADRPPGWPGLARRSTTNPASPWMSPRRCRCSWSTARRARSRSADATDFLRAALGSDRRRHAAGPRPGHRVRPARRPTRCGASGSSCWPAWSGSRPASRRRSARSSRPAAASWSCPAAGRSTPAPGTPRAGCPPGSRTGSATRPTGRRSPTPRRGRSPAR